MRRLGLSLSAALLLLAAASPQALGQAYIWTGATDSDWNTNNNWNPNTGYPSGATDTATINNGGTATQTAASSISIASITVTSGTFNQAANANITLTGTFTVNGGTFSGTNQTISVGALTISSGTFTVTGGTTTVTGAVTLSGTGTFNAAGTINVGGNWTKTGGTFNYGTSTVVFNGTAAQAVSTNDTSTATYAAATAGTTWTVPAGVTAITVKTWGAGGGGGGGGATIAGGAGGGAGFARADLAVTPAENLTVFVGGGGGLGNTNLNGVNTAGSGGGGGGYSAVKRGGTSLVLSAGGGGGGGGDNTAGAAVGVGGVGGASTGGTGGNSGAVTGGGGGTQTAGGAAGVGNGTPTAGASLAGGNGGHLAGAAPAGGTNGGGSGGGGESAVGRPGGGGGGAGYYGGGGGGASNAANLSGAGGGGGSNFISGTNTTTSQGSGQNAANNGDADYAGNAGRGGNGGAVFANGGAGNPGLVVIRYPSGASFYSITVTNTAGVTLNNIMSAAGTLTVSGGGVLSGSALTLTGAGTYEMQSGSVSVTLAGSGTVMNKTTAGTVTLSGGNSFTGGTTLSAGTLNINSDSALGTGTFTISGGTVDCTNGARSITNVMSIGGDFAFTGTANLTQGTGAVTLTGANRTLTVNASTLALGGVIGDGGNNYRLIKDGAGTLTLSSANTFTNGVTLSNGQLNINNAQALGTTAGTFRIANGTVVDNTSGGAITTLNYPIVLRNFTFVGSNELNLGTGAVTITGNSRTVTVTASTLTLGGAVNDGGNNYSLTKDGAGTLTLGGTNTHTGGTTLAAGTLNVNADAALGTGTFTISGGTVDCTNGARNVTNAMSIGASFTFTGTASLTQGTGAITLTASPTVTVSGNTLTLGGAISGTGSLTKAGAGISVLSGTVTIGGNLTISAGTLAGSGNTISVGGNWTNNGTFTHGNGTVTFNASSGTPTIGGSAGTTFYNLTKNSAQALTVGDAAAAGLTIAVSNAFTWTDNNDTITVGNGQTVTFQVPSITVAAGCTLRGTASVSGPLTVSGGTVAPGTSGSVGSLTGGTTGDFSGAGALTARVSGYVAGTSHDRLAMTGALTLGGTSALTLDLTGLGSTGTATGVVTCTNTPAAFGAVTITNNTNSYNVTLQYAAGTVNAVVSSGGATLYWHPQGVSTNGNLATNWTTDQAGLVRAASINATDNLNFGGTGTNADNACTLTAGLTCASIDSTGYAGAFSTANFSVTASTLAWPAGTFNAGSSTVTVTGTGTPFTAGGTFNAGTSTFKYAPSSVGTAWLPGFDYRKSHVINSATGAGTGYQVKVTAYYGAGADGGGSVYLGGKGRTDFGDVRFTSSDGSTELSYWIESKTDSNNAVFWVKVAEDLGSNRTVYIYYGSSSAATTSSGDGTFLFFDDFSGDLSKWTKHRNGDWVNIESGYLNCGGGATGGVPYGHTVLGSAATYTGFTDGVIEGRVNLSANGIGEVSYRGNFGGDTGYKSRVDNRAGQGIGNLKPPYTPGVWQFLASGGGPSGTAIPSGSWLPFTITVSGTSMTIVCNGQTLTGTDAQYAGPGEISLQNHYGAYSLFDDIRVRKYVNPEPSHAAAWGGEETQAPDVDVSAAVSYHHLTMAPSAAGHGFRLGTGAGQTVTVGGNLTVGGGSAVCLASAAGYNPVLAVTGNCSILGGSTLTASSSGSFSVGGNWTNNGSFIAGTGTVTLNGASVGQSLGGSASTTFYNLTKNTAQALTVGDSATAGKTITVSNTFTWTDNNDTITVGNGRTVTFQVPAVSIAAGCTLASTSDGTVRTAGNWINDGTFTHGNGTVTLNASSGTQTVGGSVGSSFYNLNLWSAGARQVGNDTAARTFTVANTLSWVSGNLTVGQSGVADLLNLTGASANLTVPTGCTLTTVGAAVVNVRGSSGTNGINILTGATLTLTLGGTSAIVCGGNWTNNGTFTANTSGVTLNGPAAQTVAGSANTTFYNLTKNTAQPLTVGDAATAGRTITVSNTFTWTDQDDTITVGNGRTVTFQVPAVTIAAGCILVTTNDGTAALTGAWNNAAGTYTPNQGTVRFNGSGAQAVTTGGVGAGKAFYNVYVDNTAGTPGDAVDVDTVGAIKVDGTLTVNDGQFQPDTASDFTGVVINANGIFKPDPAAAVTVSGNWTNAGTFTHNSGTVTFDGSSAQTVGGSADTAFHNLTLSNNQTRQFGDATTGGRTFTVANTFTWSDGDVQVGQGALVDTLTVAAASVTVPAGRSLTTVGTSAFNVNGAAGTNGVTIASGGTLALGAGTSSVTCGGNWTNNGTFTHGSGSVTLNGSAAQTVGGSADTAFHNLTLSNNQTRQFGDATTGGRTFTVANTFTWSGGNIQVGQGALVDTLTLSAASVTVPSGRNLRTAGTSAFNVNGAAGTNGITLASGGTLTLADATSSINCGGNFTNNSATTFVANGGTVTMDGTSGTQVIGGAADTTFAVLVKDSSRPLVVGDAATAGRTITVSGTFTWTDNNDTITVGNGQTVTFVVPAMSVPGGCTLDLLADVTLATGGAISAGTGSVFRVSGVSAEDGYALIRSSAPGTTYYTMTLDGEVDVEYAHIDNLADAGLTLDANSTATSFKGVVFGAGESSSVCYLHVEGGDWDGYTFLGLGFEDVGVGTKTIEITTGDSVLVSGYATDDQTVPGYPVGTTWTAGDGTDLDTASGGGTGDVEWAPTAAEGLVARAERKANGVEVTWSALSERGTVGYAILRRPVPAGAPNPQPVTWKKLAEVPAAAFGGEPAGSEYHWLDESAEAGDRATRHEYRVEEIEADRPSGRAASALATAAPAAPER